MTLVFDELKEIIGLEVASGYNSIVIVRITQIRRNFMKRLAIWQALCVIMLLGKKRHAD